MRYLVILLLILIILSLASALVYIIRSKETHPRVLRSLTLRVALSVTLFLILIVGHQLGWIGGKL